MTQKTSIIIGIIFFVLLGGVLVYFGKAEAPVLPNNAKESAIEEGGRRTLVGVFTCLPHRGLGGQVTLECAFGLKTDDGKYFALDLQALPSETMNLPMGKPLSVTGIVVPVEALSSDHWRKYDIRGIMRAEELREL